MFARRVTENYPLVAKIFKRLFMSIGLRHMDLHTERSLCPECYELSQNPCWRRTVCYFMQWAEEESPLWSEFFSRRVQIHELSVGISGGASSSPRTPSRLAFALSSSLSGCIGSVRRQGDFPSLPATGYARYLLRNLAAK